MQNLDLACAQLGRDLAKRAGDEKLLTSALAVLAEQGLYAYFLFLKARGQKPGGKVSQASAEFLTKMPEGAPILPDAGNDIFAAIQGLAKDLDGLLLARDLLLQALVYARYHAKAGSEGRG